MPRGGAPAIVELRRCGHVLQRGHVAVDSAIAVPLHCDDLDGAREAARDAVAMLKPKVADVVERLQETQIASAALLTNQETHALEQAQVLADVFIENLESKVGALDNFADDEAKTRALLRDIVTGAVESADAVVIEGGRGRDLLRPIVEFRGKSALRRRAVALNSTALRRVTGHAVVRMHGLLARARRCSRAAEANVWGTTLPGGWAENEPYLTSSGRRFPA